MALARETEGAVAPALERAWPEADQRGRCLAS